MRLASARVRRVAGRLPAEVHNSRATWTERRGLLLQLATEDGRIGQGDASPLPGYSSDTLEECEAALAALCSSPLGEIDLDASAAPQVRQWLQSRDLPAAARFAAETALFDLIAQSTNRPMAELLGSDVAPHEVPVAALLDSGGDAGATSTEAGATSTSAGNRAEVLRAASTARARGVRTFKVKIGSPGMFDGELEVLRALRRELGWGVQLRLDANGAFPLDEAFDRLRALAELKPEFIEEPVPLGQLAAFALSRPSLPLPLAADESLAHPRLLPDLLPAFERGRVEVAVLKPTLLGGALACLDLTGRLAPLGARFTVTHAFEGPIALKAATVLASVLPGLILAAGLDRHPGLAIWAEMDSA